MRPEGIWILEGPLYTKALLDILPGTPQVLLLRNIVIMRG
jgi:hypothetical protein